MGTTDRFSRGEVQRILDVTEKQLDYWERLRIICPKKGRGEKFYDFRDLIGLRTAKQLIAAGVLGQRAIVVASQKIDSAVDGVMGQAHVLAATGAGAVSELR